MACLASSCAAAGCGSSQPHQSATSTTGPHPSSNSETTTTAPASTSATWTTYHRDAARTGVDPTEPQASQVVQAWKTTLDGQVYAEPLVDGNRVIAATENDTVYSLDAANGAVEWSTHLGTPMPGSALPCGNIDPSGITSTPVIDTSSGIVYAVAFVEPGEHQLVGIDLGSGQVSSRRTISLPGGVDPLAEQQRGALALENGRVYVPFGGLFGDCGNYRGFVVGIPTSAGTPIVFSVPTEREGAIWSPPGPVIDSQGDLFVTTGNSASETTYDDGDSVIRLSPDLVQLDTFAPSDWPALNEQDLDLGSVSPTLVDGDLVFQIGKSGIGYLLSAGHLGGVGGQLFSAQVCSGAAFGGTAVYGSTVFVPCRDGLRAVRVGPGDSFSVAWSAPAAAVAAPIVAGGAVWGITRSGQLMELSPETGQILLSAPVGAIETSFPSLSAGGGRIFAQGGDAIVAFSGV